MSEKNFTEKRAKWERWLSERQEAGNAGEPLLVFVDDEKYQRDMRYYEMRLQKHPGRNILLFENADEGIEFIKFATEKNLHLGAVVSDFDNGAVSDTRGSKVLEAAIEYGEKIYGSFAFQLDRLKDRISSTYKEDEKATAYAAMASLLPNQSTAGNPLDDKNFVESLQEKYANQPDPFATFLAEAANNIDDTRHPFKKEEQQKFVKLLISSTLRPISLDHEHNKPLAEFNATDEAQRQGEILTFEKNNHHILGHLLEVPKPERSLAENPKLIPDLIYTMNIVDAMLQKFKDEFKPYKSKIPPDQTGEEQTIAEIYAPAIKMIKRSERRIEDMLKLWALVKEYEFRQERESNWKTYSELLPKNRTSV